MSDASDFPLLRDSDVAGPGAAFNDDSIDSDIAGPGATADNNSIDVDVRGSAATFNDNCFYNTACIMARSRHRLLHCLIHLDPLP